MKKTITLKQHNPSVLQPLLNSRALKSLICASPFGQAAALLDASDTAKPTLIALGFAGQKMPAEAVLEDLAKQVKRSSKSAVIPAIVGSSRVLAEQMLACVFAGKAGVLNVYGTTFQCRVWAALCAIPAGAQVTYGQLAKQLGTSPRALGGAVGENRLSYLIPCHRVVAADGSLHGFRWGLDVKEKILSAES